ncbi:MAG: tolB protein precursor [Candidatus Dadabacteria bacterium]
MANSVTEKIRSFFTILIILTLSSSIANAQYFGRNKVLYQNFDFRVTQTPHFEIYNYLENKNVKQHFAQNTEQWYHMHQAVLRDTFKERNPLIVYNSHAHFQETRAIEGQIDVGTGGVTEALKNRIVMPFMESNAQTDHVLGHEMVHAFQYHLIRDSFNLNALNNLPLWMVEGMAEYVSTGYIDANTTMWLRSSLADNKLPTLKDLNNRPDLYFPYRWGEAFWAYVTGKYGDEMVRKLFIESAKRGYDVAIKNLFKVNEKEFSKQWQDAIRSSFSPFQASTSANAIGQNLVGKEKAGRLNIVPSISPDGKYVAFWTEKNLFSIDLYLADAISGKIIHKLTSNSINSHIDQYSSYESSVAWSPDSRRVAFVAFAKGRNRLLIVDTRGKMEQELDIPGVSSFSNPTWSPDGNTLVLTGLVEGQSDLYSYNLNTQRVKQLTNDHYSDILPSFSPDGKTIAFTTDRLSNTGNGQRHLYSHNVALYDLASGTITNLELFPGANNMNPVFGTDNNNIYFLSDRDGFRNMYSYNLTSKALSQLTNLFTGIAGITVFSPAISISRNTGEVVYSYYSKNGYTIYSARMSDFAAKPVEAGNVNMQAAIMPPFTRLGRDIVQANITNPPALTTADVAMKEVPYKPKFQLDYIGNTGVGIQTGGSYGTGMAGGINGIFSDMVGNHQLFGAVSLNGEVYDLAGQFAYLNQKNRFNWGAAVSHIPYVSGAQRLAYDSLSDRNGNKVPALSSSLDLLRTFEDQVQVFGSYPFSTIQRIEAGGSFARYYYRMDRYTDYYDPSGYYYYTSTRTKQPTPSGFNFGQTYLALVGDNSNFGVTAPLTGHRYRMEAGQYFGVVSLTNLLGDYRKYFRFAPFTFAARELYAGRFGRDAGTGVLPPLFIGYPTLVRGYSAMQYSEGTNPNETVGINDLIGSQMFVSNAELRFPLTGPERLSAITSRFLLTDLNLFTDGGVAWGQAYDVNGNGITNVKNLKGSKFIMSSGVSLRVNVFGYLVVEPYYAIPWQNGGFKNASFGFNFVPGW